jgi:hypothetical protein
MLPFGRVGTHLELQAKAPFTSSIISLTFGILVCDNGKASHVGCKFYQNIVFKFYFPSILFEF